MRIFFKQGMGLVEIVIGSAIIIIGILALSQAYVAYVRYALANDKNIQAAYLIEEDLEAVTFLRDKSWTSYIQPLSTTTTYYLAWNSNNSYWQSTTTVQYVDTVFLRQFTVSDVSRDVNGLITTSGGTYDPNTKKITATISYYQGNATTTQSISTYITNLYSN